VINRKPQKRLLDQATRAFENGSGDGAAEHEREIERLHAKTAVACDVVSQAPSRYPEGEGLDSKGLNLGTV
jgi:hypothetical protein